MRNLLRICIYIGLLLGLILGYMVLKEIYSTYTLVDLSEEITRIGRERVSRVTTLDASVDLDLTVPNRDLASLTPATKLLAEQFLEETKKQGYHLFVTEGHRSLERQKALFDQGRSKPGAIVTRTMNSRHIEGRAFDVAFDPTYHGSAYPTDEQIREEIGRIGESMGLIWGGRWRRPDKPHFQNGW